MDKLYGLIQDINPKEICNHIENGNLAEWCNAWRIAAKESLQPKTNADRIRAMTDEELAYLIRCGVCELIGATQDHCETNTCVDCVLGWLKQTAE